MNVIIIFGVIFAYIWLEKNSYMNIITVKPLNNWHNWDLKIVSVTERYLLHRGFSQMAYFALKTCSKVLRYNEIDPEVCLKAGPVLWEERALRQCIRGYHLYMIIWSHRLGSVCNAWKSQLKKWKRMLLLWFVLIDAVKERCLTMCSRYLLDFIHVSIPTTLFLGHLWDWEMRQPWR